MDSPSNSKDEVLISLIKFLKTNNEKHSLMIRFIDNIEANPKQDISSSEPKRKTILLHEQSLI